MLVKSIWPSLPPLSKPLSSFHLAPASNLPSDTVQTCCRLSVTHLTPPGAQEPLLTTHHLLWLKQGSRPPVNSGKPISRAVPKPWASLRQLGPNGRGMMARAGLPLCCMGSKGWMESLSCLHFWPPPIAESVLPPAHRVHRGMAQEGHTMPSRTALELPGTGASDRTPSWPRHPRSCLRTRT